MGQVGVGHTEYEVRVPTKIMDKVKLPDKKYSDVVFVAKEETVKTSFDLPVSEWAVGEIENALLKNLIPQALIITQRILMNVHQFN